MNIGGAGSYIYEKPQIEGQTAPGPIEHVSKVEEKKVSAPPKGPSKGWCQSDIMGFGIWAQCIVGVLGQQNCAPASMAPQGSGCLTGFNDFVIWANSSPLGPVCPCGLC